MNYALVIILKKPGGFDAPLTYKIPTALGSKIKLGRGVSIPLRGLEVRGVVISMSVETEFPLSEIKEIVSVLPDLWVSETYLELARAMGSYYKCSLLRVLKLMLPTHLWKGTGKRILNKFNEEGYQAPENSIFPLTPFKHVLTMEQEEALKKIRGTKKPTLLHGVTGSGKTELYLRLILDAAAEGKQSILLLPEIGLTPQMIDYFSDYFGEHLAIFHSKLSNGERLNNWLKVRLGHAKLIIGSRSAIFAPCKNLGLIIMDEEHEWTYKQESSPYYQTHQVAEMLKDLTGARLVMGTATPRLETLHKANVAEYEYVRLSTRVNEMGLPKIEVIDLRDEFKKKNYSIFSHSLANKIRSRIEKKEQIILFVNQRGVARAVVCRDCGIAVTCPHCEVSLKLHNPNSDMNGKLLCHYCGYEAKPRLSCSECGSINIRHVGIGTQRVEQELYKVFPGVRVLRADKDTTSDKQGFEPIYQTFKNGEFDVLVGTQMVAKGHDFPLVTLIGIILADIGLHIPDFRSHERLFHLITQVAGRAGRGKVTGEVVLQTYQPKHHAIVMAANYQYDEFAANELKFRKKLSYPPFSQLVKFTILGQDLVKLKEKIQIEKEILEDIFKVNGIKAKVLTAPAMIPRMGGFYYYHVLIRMENTKILFKHWKVPKGWRVDIDPIHTT